MTYTKTILCLANSRRPGGRCIAGKEVVDDVVGSWVRPIRNVESEAIPEKDRRYEDGTYARVLDIIEIEFKEHLPDGHQTENHVIDHRYYWEKVGQADWENVVDALDEFDGELWIDRQSTYYGDYDRISEDEASAGASPASVRPCSADDPDGLDK